jgi:hypothetical protein
MSSQKSPGGSTFPYYYKGGEIHCLKYGNFLGNLEALFALMKAEEEFIVKTNRPLRIWVDFYDTNHSDQVLMEFAANISRIRDHMIKLAVVGFTFFDKLRFRKFTRNQNLPMPLKFFTDPEDAKTWLIGDY